MFIASPSVSPRGMNPGPANLSMPITFTCHASGEPLPNITWHFNNTELVFPHTNYEMNLTVVNSTTVFSSLTVQSVTSSDFGLYMCLASNDAGNSNVTGVLTTNGNVQVYYTGHTQVLHMCTTSILCSLMHASTHVYHTNMQKYI